MQQQLQRLLQCTSENCPGGEITPSRTDEEVVLRCLGCNDIKYRGMSA